ncbi:hypothetical protein SAMD00019534_014790 [Acytostelium subglobosum LB1]|uniref:hypothetical protein n=1 Tax=Acytostelium subglobosum LB1 TaxID=1410327 RepID=UPI000644E5ED|nr:hypothetical protein SAMD00019534_014790 [Acytostelium subglobosum LB1]GAM18304.1 hypothetical protein SAMD00019534_014790 [Acytostelium subglobosum LB1]|eukprot:XP_012757524.1 hypothetical protein SAMD00019534_014790 [Acytostelium subglobosum LB1]
MDASFQTLWRNSVIRGEVIRQIRQIHVVLMRADKKPLTRILPGEQIDKDRCLLTMLRFGRTDLFMKHFDPFVLAMRHIHRIPLSTRFLLKRAIELNNIDVARHLLQFNRNNGLSHDSVALIEGGMLVEEVAQEDRHEMLALLLSECDNNNQLSTIRLRDMYHQCRSYKMLETIHLQRHRFRSDDIDCPFFIDSQVTDNLTCEELPSFLDLLHSDPGPFSDCILKTMVRLMKDPCLLKSLIQQPTLEQQFIDDSLSSDSFKDIDGVLVQAYQCHDSLDFVQRYREHLSVDLLYRAAAIHGDLPLAHWTHTYRHQALEFGDQVAMALEHGHLDVALYLLDNVPLNNDSEHSDGDETWSVGEIHDSILSMDLLQRLAKYNNVQWTVAILQSPALKLDMFQFLMDSFFKYHDLQHLEMTHIKDITLFKHLVQVFKVAALTNDDLVKFIVAKRSDILEALAESGFLVGLEAIKELETADDVRLLLSSGCLEPRVRYDSFPSPLDHVVAIGDLSLVIDIHTQFGHVDHISSPNAMEYAAMYNLDLVRFLHKHRTEGCTKDTLQMAVNHGHMDIVQFLIDNRTETWRLSSLFIGVENGHVDIVDFILQSKDLQLSWPRIEQFFAYARTGHMPLLEAYVDMVTRQSDQRACVERLCYGHGKHQIAGSIAKAMTCGYQASVCLQFIIDQLFLSHQEFLDYGELLRLACERGHIRMMEYFHKIPQCE